MLGFVPQPNLRLNSFSLCPLCLCGFFPSYSPLFIRVVRGDRKVGFRSLSPTENIRNVTFCIFSLNSGTNREQENPTQRQNNDKIFYPNFPKSSKSALAHFSSGQFGGDRLYKINLVLIHRYSSLQGNQILPKNPSHFLSQGIFYVH